MDDLELELGRIDILLQRDEFDSALELIASVQRDFPDYPKHPQGYLVPYSHGVAIFQQTMDSDVKEDVLRQAKKDFQQSLRMSSDFDAAHYLEALVSILLYKQGVQDAVYLELNAQHHLRRAQELAQNQLLVTEVNKQLEDVERMVAQHYTLALCSRDEGMVVRWQHEFQQYPWVEIIHGDILQQRADAIVSPANSFGFMDGGLDYQLSEYFGWDLQMKVQETIKQKYHGELPVGEAEIFETGKSEMPYLISAPTMRVPMSVEGTTNPYVATRAVFLAVNDFNAEERRIRSVLIPGMGTGVGMVPYDVAARQMRAAYEQAFLGIIDFPEDFAEAQDRQRVLLVGH